MQIIISKVVNVFFKNKNDQIQKDLTGFTAQRSSKTRCTCTCSIRTGTSVLTWAHVVSSTDNYKEEDQNIIKLKKNLSIHFSRRNLKCMNDRNSMFDDCHISQIHGQVVVRILRKQEILKLKTKNEDLP